MGLVAARRRFLVLRSEHATCVDLEQAIVVATVALVAVEQLVLVHTVEQLARALVVLVQ